MNRKSPTSGKKPAAKPIQKPISKPPVKNGVQKKPVVIDVQEGETEQQAKDRTMQQTSLALTQDKSYALASSTSQLFTALAEQVKIALTQEPTHMPALFETISNLEDNLEKMSKMLKGALKDKVMAEGKSVGDKGAKELVLGGMRVPVIARGLGTYDAKKVEALLRESDLDPATYMDAEISYSVNVEKMAALLADPAWKTELAACMKEPNYALMRPEPLGDA